MFDFSPANLIAGLIFGVIGMAAFGFGKKHGEITKMVVGVALMIFPYAVSNTWLLYGIGVVLTVLVFVWHDDS